MSHRRSEFQVRAEDASSARRLPPALQHSVTRVAFGAGRLAELGAVVRDVLTDPQHGKQPGDGWHVLLVTDPGIVAVGYADRAAASLRAVGFSVTIFSGAAENPTTEHVAAGVKVARGAGTIDLLVGVGGGSAMDCAKGINFILTNGGQMKDYWGVGKAKKRMLPMIAVPTTAGTGSEAQSFALISDPVTHQKMACGDPKAACRAALLDPDLTRTQPPRVAAAAGIDAVAHAVETAAATRRNDVSLEFTRQAWARIDRSFERAMRDSNDDGARADMLLGAHLAGAAIEKSMLGAAHACANPLTAKYGIAHGVAVGLMLPHVVRFNAVSGMNPYEALGLKPDPLIERIEVMLSTARLPRTLSECGVEAASLRQLAASAASQWTASFNPRPVDADSLLEIYRSALE